MTEFKKDERPVKMNNFCFELTFGAKVKRK